MNVSELLTDLGKQGIQVWINGDKLGVRAPKGRLTADLRDQLAARKTEILAWLQAQEEVPQTLTQAPSLQTIGRLIGGSFDPSEPNARPPVIDPKVMAQKLAITFRPLPKGFHNPEILKVREELQAQLRAFGVQVVPWEEATIDFRFEFTVPVLEWKRSIKTRVVKAAINAVIDVERPASLGRRLGILTSEGFYGMYTRFILRDRKLTVSRIATLSSWAEDHAARYIEDPTNTQVIILTQLDETFSDPTLSYQNKIKIGLNTLIRTFSELVIGVSPTKLSILNMNLSDSVYTRQQMDRFVLNSLIPKVFVPILPLPLSRFKLEEYTPQQSPYALSLVTLGQQMAQTQLLPPGARLSEVIKRRSHRDIVNVIVNGRTGVSYGFVAYAEPPHYVGPQQISAEEWENLQPVQGYNRQEVRQNALGRRYLTAMQDGSKVYRQIPDIWVVSSRSGANKTDLRLDRDVLRLGLTDRLVLQVPEGCDPTQSDIKPSYDIYVMLAITLATALYFPTLAQAGVPIVHFHGYPDFSWFKADEYYVGVDNPSVPCGTYESGVFNFLGIYNLSQQVERNLALVSLIEPDHGTNIVACTPEYLVERLKSGVIERQVELGGRHFASLKDH
ncbi:TubC N-terminal docking domain-related protein [Anthocerotibacter panamensis]|uniref:TubC N-terminal docking domain-related protein n=1 Tax=Anthocerotibacter panamensis TaxID=2857077 RepID=UPI001C40386F|nr:hypothetical protein [Anthocerotibacter panamensis]